MTPEDELAALLDPLDYPGDWTERQRNTYTAKREALQAQVRAEQVRAETAQNVRFSLLSLETEIAALTRWKAFLTTARQTLCDELLAPRGRTRADLDRSANLETSIKSIDRGLQQLLHAPSGCYTLKSLRLGELMQEAGYVATDNERDRMFGGLPWHGSLKDVDKEMADLTKRRDAATAQLAAVSLSNAERAAQQAERNARPTRKTRGDGSMYDKFPDGTIVEVQATSS